MFDQKIIGLSILAIFLFGAVIVTANLTQIKTQTKTRAGISSETTVPALILSPSETIVASGQPFNLDVYLNTSGQPINGATALIDFDPNLLTVAEVLSGQLQGSYPAKSANNQNGRVFLSWVAYNPQNPNESASFSGSSLLGQIRFQAKSVSQETKTAISFNFSPGLTNDSNLTNSNGQDILTKVSNSTIIIKP